MNNGRIFQRVENALHAVFDGQHKTSRQLPQAPAGIHQGGRVGQELEIRHQGIELLGDFLDVGVLVVFFLRLGDVPGHPVKHLGRRLLDPAIRIFLQIAPIKYGFGVGRKIDAVSDEHVPGQPHRPLGIQPVFGQFGLDHLIHHWRRNVPKVHAVDGGSNELGDLFGLTLVDGIGANETLAENLVIPDMGVQVHVSIVHDENFLFMCHRVSQLHNRVSGLRTYYPDPEPRFRLQTFGFKAVSIRLRILREKETPSTYQ